MLVVRRDQSHGGKAHCILCYWLERPVGWWKRESVDLKILSSKYVEGLAIQCIVLPLFFISMRSRYVFVSLAWLNIYYLWFFEILWLGIQEYFWNIFEENPFSFTGRMIFKFVHATETQLRFYIPTNNQEGTLQD